MGDNSKPLSSLPAKPRKLITSSAVNKRREWLLYVFTLAFVLLSLLLLYKVPFNGDDAINCMTGGALAFGHRTIWQHTSMLYKNWLDTGRVYPLAFYSYALFSALPTLFAYRTFQIVLNMTVIASFGALTHRLTKSSQAAAAAMLLIPVFIQFRYYQDPVMAYHGMLQFVALYLIWAMYLQIYGIEKGKVIPIIGSSLLYLCCLLTYEISFAFILIFVLISIHYGKGAGKFINVNPHLLVTAAILGVTFYYRTHAANASYAGVSISWNIWKILKAFISQISSAIPLSYWLLATPTFLIYGIRQFIFAITFWDVFLSVTLGVLLLAIFFFLPRRKIPLSLFLYGLVLWLLPASIISLSLRYQTELSPGVGYLPIYIQYFGGALIAVSTIHYIFMRVKNEKANRIFAFLIALCFSLGFLINNINNRQIKNVYADNNCQALSAAAMNDGILDRLEDNDALLVLGGGYGLVFDPASFICLNAGGLRISSKSLQMLTDTEKDKKNSGIAVLNPEDLYVFLSAGDLLCGSAVVGKVESITFDSESQTITQVTVSEVTIYVCDSGNGILHISSQAPDGTLTGTDILTSDIFAEPDSDNKNILKSDGQISGINIDINRITAVHEPEGISKISQLDQEKTCTITIEAVDNPIVFNTIAVAGPG